MPGDTVRVLKMRERLRAVQSKAERLQANRDQVVVDLLARRQEVERLAEQQDVLTKVLELYRILMDKMVFGQVQALESVVSEGLKSIFADQDLSFKLELSHKYNKVCAEPYVCQGDIKGHPLDSFGGGPASIISLILRVLILLRLKRYRMLFLDETLAAVAEQYVEATGIFLRKLSESSGLPILLVTHTHAFLEHATVGYQGDSRSEDGREYFVVRKIRGSA